MQRQPPNVSIVPARLFICPRHPWQCCVAGKGAGLSCAWSIAQKTAQQRAGESCHSVLAAGACSSSHLMGRGGRVTGLLAFLSPLGVCGGNLDFSSSWGVDGLLQSGGSASAGVRGRQGAELSQPGLRGRCPAGTPGLCSPLPKTIPGVFHLSMKGNERSLESEMQRNGIQL